MLHCPIHACMDTELHKYSLVCMCAIRISHITCRFWNVSFLLFVNVCAIKILPRHATNTEFFTKANGVFNTPSLTFVMMFLYFDVPSIIR